MQKPKGISECFQPSPAKSTTVPDVKRNKLKMGSLALYFPDRNGSRVAGREEGETGVVLWSSCVRNAVTGVSGAETGLSLPVPVPRGAWQPGGAGWCSEQAQSLHLLSEKFLVAPVGVLGVHVEWGAPSQGRTAGVTQTQLRASSGAGSALE